MAALEYITAVVDIGKGKLFFTTTLQNQVPVLFAELLIGRINVEAVVLGQGIKHVEVVDIAPVPTPNGTFSQAGLGVQHNALFIEILLNTQAITTATGAGGVVEGEKSRLQFVYAVTTLWAGEAGGE